MTIVITMRDRKHMGEHKVDLNYDNFFELPVVKRLREVIGKWWKIQLNFTDEKGYLRGVPHGKFFNPVNKICKAITGNNKTFLDCKNIARQTSENSKKTNGYCLNTCHAGFSTLSLPLFIEGEYMGCIFADGFLIEETEKTQKETLRKYLYKSMPVQAIGLEKFLDSLPILTKKDLTYLKEILKIFIEETLLLHKQIDTHQSVLNAYATEFEDRWDFHNIIGVSAPMMKLLKLLKKVAPTDSTILVTGENGTGKEVISKAIHVNSRRKSKPFIAQNCGALNDNLLESELFGHVKGSFSGAIKDKKGLFELADGGTLFLDEIGDTSLNMQVKLLRVLQESTFVPVGGMQEKKVNVRIIAATNKNLLEMIEEGTFREDLYYRLNIINIETPPLRERHEDIPLLVNFFLTSICKRYQKNQKRLTADCLYRLENYTWPGNVRELRNEIERLVVLSEDDALKLDSDLLSDRILQATSAKPLKKEGTELNDVSQQGEISLEDNIKNFEKGILKKYLIEYKGNYDSISKKLGLTKAQLTQKIKKLSIQPPLKK